jgi:hypothetical protein
MPNILLAWNSVQPDKRQWKPSLPTLFPMDVYIQVEVPNEFFGEKLEIDDRKILTPAGMRYVIDKLEEVMSDKIPNTNDTQDDEFDFDTDDTNNQETTKTTNDNEEIWE